MNGKVSFWSVRIAGGWGVKKQGSAEILKVHARQQDAWLDARRRTGGKQEAPRHDVLNRSAADRTGRGAARSGQGMARALVSAKPGPVRPSASIRGNHAA